MKSKSFLSTFIRYSFSAVFFLWITYLLADMHINKIPGFSLEEGFMIAGEFLVYFAFILAMKDTKKSELEEFMEGVNFHMMPICEGHDENYSKGIKDSVEELMKFGKKTTKGIPLSAEHKKKISESLKKKNAEKKRMLFRPAVTAKTQKKPQAKGNPYKIQK